MCHACVIVQYASFHCAHAFVVHLAKLAVDFLLWQHVTNGEYRFFSERVNKKIIEWPFNSKKIAAMAVVLKLIYSIFCEILRAAEWNENR